MDFWTNLRFVTRALRLSEEAQNVYLFGSTARQLRTFVGEHVDEFNKTPDPVDFSCNSRDLDLVVTVKQDVYDAWNRLLNQQLRVCGVDCSGPQGAYHGCKWIRFNLALELLGCGTYHDLMPLFGWLTTLDSVKELDFHLMPEDWRKQIVAVQDHLPHNDPNFVGNIARDAVNLTETDPNNVTAWQGSIFDRIARNKRVVEHVGRAALLSAVISTGLTAEASK